MDEQEAARHIASLEARMRRLEILLLRLVQTLSTSQSHINQLQQLQAISHELRNGQ